MSTTPSRTPAIELRGLTKRFGSAVAVNRLDLVIPRGCIFGLLGQNGAGKTTTLKMLMRLLPMDAGQAIVLGIDVAKNPSRMKRLVGYVPEVHNIYAWMTVGQVIGFVKAFYPTWNDTLSDELRALFNLDHNKKVRHLSRGMLAKLSLLLAVAHEPELLILDEPMTGLDPIVREEFLDSVMATLGHRGSSVFFSSHTIDEVQRIADVVGILHQGELLVHRATKDLLGSVKRIKAVLRPGAAPGFVPGKTICQSVAGRDWFLTVDGWSEKWSSEFRARHSLESLEVSTCTLEMIFKDYVRGAPNTLENATLERAASQ